jgi:hypothetical protein
MLRRLRPALAPLLAVVLVAPALYVTTRRVLAGMGADKPFDVRYVPTGGALRVLSEDLQLTIANYYWLQTVQYIGETRGNQRGWDRLFPLVDLVTDLDPRHGYAFQTGGIMLSTLQRPDESDRILKKGIERGPRWWTFPFYIAFNDYFFRGDYESAARWAELAARTPGASTNISHLALSMKVKSGSPDDAVRFVGEMLATAKDDATRAALEEQYKLALLQRDFGRLDAAVATFKARAGRPPRSLEEVRGVGLLAAIPEEPFGGHYLLDAEGVVHSSARDQRFKPAEPGRLQAPAWAPPQLTKDSK